MSYRNQLQQKEVKVITVTSCLLHCNVFRMVSKSYDINQALFRSMKISKGC